MDEFGAMEMTAPPILEDLECFHAGRLSPEVLQQRVEAALAQLKNLQSLFRKTVSGESEAIQGWLRAEVLFVERRLDEYIAVTARIAREPQTVELDWLRSELPLRCSQVNLGFAAFREGAMIARGPTSHAGLNMLLSLKSWYLGASDLDKPQIAKKLDSTLRLEFRRDHTAMSQSDLLSQDLGQFEAAYREALQQDWRVPEWDELLRSLGGEFLQIDAQYVVRFWSGKPSPYHWLNALVHSVQLYLEEKLRFALLTHFNELAWGELSRLRMSIASFASPEQAKMALDQIELALENLEERFDDISLDWFGTWRLSIEIAAEQLGQSVEDEVDLNFERALSGKLAFLEWASG